MHNSNETYATITQLSHDFPHKDKDRVISQDWENQRSRDKFLTNWVSKSHLRTPLNELSRTNWHRRSFSASVSRRGTLLGLWRRRFLAEFQKLGGRDAIYLVGVLVAPTPELELGNVYAAFFFIRPVFRLFYRCSVNCYVKVNHRTRPVIDWGFLYIWDLFQSPWALLDHPVSPIGSFLASERPAQGGRLGSNLGRVEGHWCPRCPLQPSIQPLWSSPLCCPSQRSLLHPRIRWTTASHLIF